MRPAEGDARAGVREGRNRMTSVSDDLRTQIVVGRRAMKEAIELAVSGWRYRRRPAGGEEEVWTPQEVCEHALAAEVMFAAAIAETIGLAAPESHPVSLPDPALATEAVDALGRLADSVFSVVDDSQLGFETVLGRSVESVLKLDAWHLRDHARQIVGVR